jgi:hypothetical protein
VQNRVEAILKTWSPAHFQLLSSFQARTGQAIDTRSIQTPPFTWNNPVVSGLITRFFPGTRLPSYQAPQGKIINVRGINIPDTSWLVLFPPAIVIPVILEGVPVRPVIYLDSGVPIEVNTLSQMLNNQVPIKWVADLDAVPVIITADTRNNLVPTKDK